MVEALSSMELYALRLVLESIAINGLSADEAFDAAMLFSTINSPLCKSDSQTNALHLC